MWSEREDKIIKIVRKRKITISEIAHELFANDDNRPMDPDISVGNTIRRIIMKCEHHKLDWTLYRKRMGGRLLIWRISL